MEPKVGTDGNSIGVIIGIVIGAAVLGVVVGVAIWKSWAGSTMAGGDKQDLEGGAAASKVAAPTQAANYARLPRRLVK